MITPSSRALEIVSRSALEASLAELRDEIADPDAGILGPSSLAWRIGSDLALFLGGGRAALLQLAHPAVAFAIDQHSRTRSDVTGRFQRTFRNVFAMVFGDLDTAFTAARRVHSVHTRIHGTIPIDVGAWRAGTPYDANDLASLLWVHATLVDTTLVLRERVDGPLPIEVKDRYHAELARFARLFGIPRDRIPITHAAHAAYMREMIPRLAVAPCAREMAGFLVGRNGGDADARRQSRGDVVDEPRDGHREPPRGDVVDGHRQPPLGRIGEAVTHALLPPRLADEFGFRATPRRTQLGLAAFLALYRRLPTAMVRVPAADQARRRLVGLGPTQSSAWIERQLFGLAQRTTRG